MLAPGLFVWAKFVTVPKEATVVEVVGQQWTWSYRFPGRDGVLGTTDARLITPDNAFGIDPNDPKGADDILISTPELHLPINKPVKLLMGRCSSGVDIKMSSAPLGSLDRKSTRLNSSHRCISYAV